MSNARQGWRERSLLLVDVRDPEGFAGQGEAAPLPGYSPDSLSGCERALLALSPVQLEALAILCRPAELLRAVASAIPAGLPAARFALETALLDRLACRLGRPLWSLLRELVPLPAGSARPVELCRLVSSRDPESVIAEVRQSFERGVRCFKFKIGPELALEQQRTLLGALRAALGGSVRLRLDANRSLSGASLPALLERLGVAQVEFVEEPLAEPCPEALHSLPWAWALDESLQHLDAPARRALALLPSCRAYMLKPTALGGFQQCALLATEALELGKSVVVSHALEGTVGWLACAHLAVALASDLAAGLWPLPHQTVPRGLMAGAWLELPRRPGLGTA